MDIGTPERYLQASWDILERRVATRVEPTTLGMLIEPGAEIATTASVGPRAVVAGGCRLEAGAEVRDSVLLGGCRVGAGARISGSILSTGAEVAAGENLEGVVWVRAKECPVRWLAPRHRTWMTKEPAI